MPDVGTVADLATALAIVVAVIFGILQVRQVERKRRETATMELLHAFWSPEYRDAFSVVVELPDDLAADRVRGLSPEELRAIRTVGSLYESLGFQVFRRALDLSILEDFGLGDNILEAWKRIRPWAEHRRRESGSPHAFEWAQWLADQIASRARGRSRGAYDEFRDARI